MTPPARPPAPALEGAGAGISAARPPPAPALPVIPSTLPVVPSALEALLARGRVRATLAMLGPAFVAAIAYVDPGNFATNIQGGAQFGYLLLWVVLAANLMAMLIQYLSAKLGIVTDRSLPELFRQRYSQKLSWGMWVQAEIMAMATDVAEFVGAALGLNLLFGVPLLPAGIITGFIAFAILGLQARGYRRFELVITALLGVIFLGFLYETLRIGPSARESLGGLVPHLAGSGSLYLAVGIIGATVMPHVIYLHSALTNGRTPVRDDAERARVLRFERLDVIIALGLAGLVNLAMLAVAAKLFPLQRTHRRLHHHPGPRRLRAARRRRRRAGLLGRAARLRHLRLERRHLRRAARDAGVRRLQHPDLRAPSDNHDPRDPRARAGTRTNRSARLQPGRALLWHPPCTHSAGAANEP